MTKAEHIGYWIAQSDDDWEAVNALYVGKKYLQSLFFTHLVLEKLCKAIWIKHNELNVPPKTHNLLYLLSKTPILLNEEQSDFLLMMNRFQLEGRYPDYVSDIYKICTKDFTNTILKQSNEHKLWLLKNLQ